MTHQDIYTKFMIEYDKANVTSSYPSLTKYEIAVILDKAYLALIAQKITGNNVRKSIFEADSKSISDLYPLVITESLTWDADASDNDLLNVEAFELPLKFLYYVSAYTDFDISKTTPSGVMNDVEYNNENKMIPMDDTIEGGTSTQYGSKRWLKITLVSHQVALNFISSSTNVPIVRNPICYIENSIEDSMLFLIVDGTIKPLYADFPRSDLRLTYIKKPESFVKVLVLEEDSNTDFELNDSMAEELVSLAISYALENVESTRLNAHIGIRGLEG